MNEAARRWARARAIDVGAIVTATVMSSGVMAQPSVAGWPPGYGPTHPAEEAAPADPGSTDAASEEMGEAPATPTTATRSSRETDWMLGAGMALSLFGVGTFVIGAYAAAKVGDLGRDPGYEAYRTGTPSGEDVCERAEAGEVVWGAPDPAEIASICDEARTWEAVQIAAIPLNIVLGVVGIVLIAKSDTVSGTEPTASPVPVVAVSPQGAFLGVDVPF